MISAGIMQCLTHSSPGFLDPKTVNLPAAFALRASSHCIQAMSKEVSNLNRQRPTTFVRCRVDTADSHLGHAQKPKFHLKRHFAWIPF